MKFEQALRRGTTGLIWRVVCEPSLSQKSLGARWHWEVPLWACWFVDVWSRPHCAVSAMISVTARWVDERLQKRVVHRTVHKAAAVLAKSQPGEVLMCTFLFRMLLLQSICSPVAVLLR